MSGVQETSREAYRSILGNINAKQKMVLDALKEHGPMSNLQMAFALHWPINRVTPRMGELVNRGLVKAVGRRMQTTGRMAIVWGAVPEKAETIAML